MASMLRFGHAAALAAAMLLAPTTGRAMDVRLMTGAQGGPWHPLGIAIAAAAARFQPDLRIEVLPGGRFATVAGVEAGDTAFAIANGPAIADRKSAAWGQRGTVCASSGV